MQGVRKAFLKLGAGAVVWLSAAGGAGAAEAIDYNRDVLPILSVNCFECHGPDAGARKGKLRLDERESLLAERKGRRPVAVGRPEESEIIKRVTTGDPDDVMPPPEVKGRLTAEQVEILKRWIEGGAVFNGHWAFRPVVRPEAPAVKGKAWVRGPVDRFVLVGLEKAGLGAAREASKETLIRRASLDLIGLPPSPEEVEAFVADRSPDAWEKLVERLLASPHYGERWGRHWLDVARYADSGGFETDIFFGHAWRYRDYVIRSFNADKPFDRFVKEQIAGDELWPGNEEARLATGMYTVGPVMQEAGMVAGRLEYDQLTDAADTTGSAFLGMTVGCARCHDHKYDPVSQREYFSLQAVFAASDQVDFAAGDGRKIRERAALRNTQKEFEAEQARERARRETDPAKRAAFVRQIGDGFIAADRELSDRVQRSTRYAALAKAVGRYRRAADGKGEPAGADAKGEEEVDPDDNDKVAVAAALAGVTAAKPADRAEGLLVEVGRIALQTAPRGDGTARAFRELKTDEEKRQYLAELGKKQLDVKKPEGFVEDLDALRLEVGLKHLGDASAIPVRVLAHREKALETKVLVRGELEQPGEVVGPGVPGRLAEGLELGAVSEKDRRARLAEWVASPRNPLTARVIANRVWQWHFGQGLVRTPNDFGIRGERPTHPELLDWLAAELVEHGWSLKHLHRVIMGSSAYRMGAVVDARVLERDPENRLLTRYQPYRLQAEVIWDALRASAGTLNRSMYGLPFAPPLDDQEQIGNFRKWPTSTPEESNRRAVYILTKRSFRFPTLSAFDLPDNVSSCGQRDVTTVPNQALTLLNNRGVKEQAEELARELRRETDGTPEKVAERAWMRVYGRKIGDEERGRVVEFLTARGGGAVEEMCLALFNTNEFIYMP